ncbi:sortase-associated OmpA-like protein PdsO [Pseudoalteromonas shioyasakiensis]|uniref:sortase-associated OmpA-like protein PdsO n=1 Tax=Pseudoalteromonas shioyasakiensis TaxID=1190813 RepID=UPI00211783EC|nr:sortase-associated OmpA-like protein PdsO [Pseudoalteromonas shioyasakiensis]MCQ8879022.1 sortase-associated OmpA-like protein PdsO [Pseudoalteromonas shioyasakiensis]
MKKLIIACTIATLFIAPNFAHAKTKQAKETHKETLVGLSTGAILGGIVGGPVGAFVGAFAGGLIGDKEVAENKIAEQQRALIVMQDKTDDYHHVLAQNAQLSEQLDHLEQNNERMALAQMNNLMAMTIQFKTGSSEIAPHFASQLDQLVSLLQSQPELQLDLNGFADQRGDELANLQLSKQRVSAVQSYLIKQGISHTRLTANAFGEQQTVANSDSFEDNVFDRRVTLTTRPSNTSQTARN